MKRGTELTGPAGDWMRKLLSFARKFRVLRPLLTATKGVFEKFRRTSEGDPRRFWDGEEVKSLQWNSPLFNSAGLEAVTLTFGRESRDAVKVTSAIELKIEVEMPSSCRLGFAVREGGGIVGFVNGQHALEFRKLTKGIWHDVRMELGSGQSAMRLEVVDGGPIFVSHPVVRSLRKNSQPPYPRAVIIMILDSLTKNLLNEYVRQNKDTSAISSFFEDAYTYENAFSQSEWTYPSIYSLVTGKTTLSHGCFERFLGAGLFPDTTGTLAQVMTDRGYVSFCYSTSPLFHPAYASNLGFQRFFFQPYERGLSYLDVTRQAIFHLESHKDCRNFLLLHYFDTHPPYKFNSEITDSPLGAFREVDPDEEWRSFIMGTDPKYGERTLSPEGLRRLRLRALSRLHEVDICLGWLFSYLERTGLASDSLVLLMSDHGDKFGCSRQPLLCDCRTHVPLLLRTPHSRGGKVDAPVAAGTDILPTILHLIDKSEATLDIQGRVLPPFGPERDLVVTESAYEGIYKAAVRTREFVLHVKGRYDPLTKKVITRDGFEQELFARKEEKSCEDVKNKHPEIASQMYQALMEHLMEHKEA